MLACGGKYYSQAPCPGQALLAEEEKHLGTEKQMKAMYPLTQRSWVLGYQIIESQNGLSWEVP